MTMTRSNGTFSMAHEKHTFCRICEPNCPVIAEFDDEGRISRLKPNLDHPSGGVACHKGLSFLDVHNDPDRLDWPRRRLNPRREDRGDFADISWDAAMEGIGARIRELREKHGHNAVAVYLGNPFAFNGSALVMAAEFQNLLDTQMRFSANTQDAANKFIALGAVYGAAEAVMIPDLPHTDYLLCLGSNPKVSRWTLISAPNNWEMIKDIRRRGGKIRFVNPRVTESSTEETGPTILIRPGTDAYLLASVLNEIEARTGFGDALVVRHGKNVAGLRDFVRKFPADTVAPVIGMEAQVIRDIAAEILAAKSAAAYMATGVNQIRQGVLCMWLVEMLNFVTGNLGREGGTYKPVGLGDDFRRVTRFRPVETTLGTFELPEPIGFSVLPGALLPDLMENGDIRALIVLGGNPLLSVGGGERAREAYEKLDLLICVDIYPSATAEMSDYVLPATDWLERPDINLLGSGLQPTPYVQYTDAMVEPAAGRRNEWWILCRMAQAIGLPSPLDSDPDETTGAGTLAALLSARGLTRETLLSMPSQTALFAEIDRASLFERCLKHEDRKIDCCPEVFSRSGLLDRCWRLFEELRDEPGSTLKMISLRTPHLHNSWLANSRRYRRGKNAENPLHMTERDAAARGFVAGEGVRVSTRFGALRTRILIDDDLCPGTVAMSHGYGNERTYGLRVARRNAGANCNSIMPVGPGSYEPMSYMSWLSGVPVIVEKLKNDQLAGDGEFQPLACSGSDNIFAGRIDPHTPVLAGGR
jgi:anaerobic selenocysteine-containing dehydrogenase